MAQSFNTSLPAILSEYVNQLEIPITKSTLIDTLQTNSYYPSLDSISNTFNKFNINNAAFKIDKEQFEKLNTPFLAYCYVRTGVKDFVLINDIDVNDITYLDENKKTKIISKKEFYKVWQNIVFLANPDENSRELKYEENKKIERKSKYKRNLLWLGVLFLLTIPVFVFLISSKELIAPLLIVVIKLLGICITTVLLWYEIDKSNTLIKNICTGKKQLNCDAVINSKASSLFGMKWSEIGFFYFVASFLFIITPGITFTDKLSLVAFTSTLASTYIIFSLYYQWKIVKQWCPLCLGTLTIILSELIWSLIYFWYSPIQSTLTSSTILLSFFCILFPIIVWYSIKPLIIKAKEAKAFEYDYKRLLYNHDIFNSLLQQQQKVPEGWEQLGINLGSNVAEYTIIKVCNPYCGPCAKLHPILEDLITNNININLKIIFTTSNDDFEAAKIVKHFLSVQAQGKVKSQKALDDWYLADIKDYNQFALKYPVDISQASEKQQEKHVDAMATWCIEAEITHTPTIFINGRRLPETYNIEELKYIL